MRIGAYGQDWTSGVLAEHLDRATPVYVDLNGLTWADSWPVLCGELVEIWTEDGRMDGRCGLQVHNNGYACPGHMEAIQAWRDEPYEYYEDF